MGNPAFSEQYLAANSGSEDVPVASSGVEGPVLGDSGEFEIYEHHGKNVSVRTTLKGTHRDLCLCYDCKSFTPSEDGQGSGCPIADAIYKNCVEHDVVTPVLECPKFVEGSTEDRARFRPADFIDRIPLGLVTLGSIGSMITGAARGITGDLVGISRFQLELPSDEAGDPPATPGAEGCCGGGCHAG
jgi:hypothetical protein